MKTVQVPRPIRDVNGLLSAFRKVDPPFGIVSVGTDPRTTYVYLEDHEGRDPAPIVEAWMDEPELRASATGQVGAQNIVEALANGVDVHTLLIQKTDPAGTVIPGDERLVITVPEGLTVSDAAPRLNEGMVMIQIGPSTKSGDFKVEVTDKAGKLRATKLPLRFVRNHAVETPEVAPTPVRKGGIMEAIRRWLGI